MHTTTHPYHRNGTTVEYRQDPIPKGDYQRQLEDESYEESDDEHDKELVKGINFPIQTDRVVRYWSDYNRVYYVPRSIQQLPELPDWEVHEGNWSYGRETFERYVSVSASLLPTPQYKNLPILTAWFVSLTPSVYTW